jgi:hypothetical protein
VAHPFALTGRTGYIVNDLPRSLAELVIARAFNRCEYCRLSQIGQEATFHIDHIVPRSAGGLTVAENLALACVSCSLRKGAKQTSVDPQTGNEVQLFHPRNESWENHFQWEGEKLVPLTSTGRATAMALALNRALIVAIRLEEMLRGRHPTH